MPKPTIIIDGDEAEEIKNYVRKRQIEGQKITFKGFVVAACREKMTRDIKERGDAEKHT